jgi:hypothetical protein
LISTRLLYLLSDGDNYKKKGTKLMQSEIMY